MQHVAGQERWSIGAWRAERERTGEKGLIEKSQSDTVVTLITRVTQKSQLNDAAVIVCLEWQDDVVHSTMF